MSLFMRLSRAVACVLPFCAVTASAGQYDSFPAFSPRSLWSGLYVGVHEAGASGDSDWTFANGTTASPGYDTGALFGAQIGYQYQWYQLVAGVDISYSGAPNVDDRAFCSGQTQICGNDLNGLLLVNGRLGYAAGRALLYGTGGYARASIGVDIDAGAAALNLSGDQRVSGWDYGGGVEYLLTPNIVVGLEYIHVDLDDKAFTLTNAAGTLAQTVSVDNEFDVVRGRISVKLGNLGSFASPGGRLK